MTHDEYRSALPELEAFGKNAQAALKEYEKAHDVALDRYADEEVTRWTAGKRQRGERFTRSDVAEIRQQAESDIAEKRSHATLVLEAAVALAEKKAASVEAHSER